MLERLDSIICNGNRKASRQVESFSFSQAHQEEFGPRRGLAEVTRLFEAIASLLRKIQDDHIRAQSAYVC
jgi:hypothetical protein